MKSLNAKRIAALAASLVMGLAFAGPVVAATTGYTGITIGNGFTVVNSAGTPTVQIVVGSTAKPSDGVVAANIAAVIGNLAFASTPIQATVNGLGGVTCVVTTPSCSLSNKEVWLGVKGSVAPSGSYLVKALIGSVLNAGVLNYNTVQNTKTLSTNTQYTYAEGTSPYAITSTPLATSAYAGVGPLTSVPTSVQATTNGGGVQFTKFTSSGQDNIVQIGNAQGVTGLEVASTGGANQESEYLWLMGFPVYNQQSNVSNFQLLDGNGAYQLVLGKPISLYSNKANFGTNSINHAQFTLLGTNWTIFNANLNPIGTQQAPTNNQFVVGGNLTLAESQVPLTLLYVGQNVTAGPLTVALQDLTYPNASGGSDAVIGVYKNGVLTNETKIAPGATATAINATGTTAYIYVSSTTPGLYATQRWAKIQVFSNIFNITNGQMFGTQNPRWLAAIHWSTNQSSVGSKTVTEELSNITLEGIVIYSNLSQSFPLTPGQGITFIQNPVAYNVTFRGDALGTPSATNTGSFDTQTITTGGPSGCMSSATVCPINFGGGGPNVVTVSLNTFSSTGTPSVTAATNQINLTAISQPVSWLTVTASSTGPGFQIQAATGAQPSSNLDKVQYDLNPYNVAANAALDIGGAQNALSNANGNEGLNVGLIGLSSGSNNYLNANYINNNQQETVTVSGYTYGNGGVPNSGLKTETFTFNGFNQLKNVTGVVFKNITNIYMSTPLPQPGAELLVFDSFNAILGVSSYVGNTPADSILMSTLTPTGPTLLYSVPQYPNYWVAPNALTSNVLYSESGYNVNYQLTQASAPSNTNRQQYFTYTIPEISTPQGATPDSNVVIGISNQSSSTETGTPIYWLNQTSGANGKLVYNSYQGYAPQVTAGFRTERGSGVGPITDTGVTFYQALSVDTLNFLVGPATAGNVLTQSTVGPFGVGATYQNITIAAINASCTLGAAGAGCTVSGLNNVTATASPSVAIAPVPLNTAVTPIAVLDSQASSTENLVVVGSKYVNSVAATIFANNPTLNSGFGPSSAPIVQQFGNQYLVAGYTANQTVQAGNTFIGDLLSAASAQGV